MRLSGGWKDKIILSLNDQVLDQIIRRLSLSITTGLFWLGIVIIFLFLLRLLRVKSPAIKYLFFTLPMAKSLMAVIREAPKTKEFNGVFIFMAQIPDLGHLVPRPPWDSMNYRLAGFYQPTTSVSMMALVAISIGALGFLIWRLWGLMRFQRLLNQAPSLDRHDNQGLFASLNRLVGETKIAFPKVILLDTAETPFTVGIKRPVIALSQNILDSLDEEEIEAALAHEVAHISRKDHLYHWPVLIMRDLLFYNPLSYFLYRRLSFERERACDDLGSRFCRPLSLANCLVKIAELQKHERSSRIVRSFAPQHLLDRKSSYFGRRVRGLIEPPTAKPTSKRFWLVMIALLIFAFFLELHLMISIRESTLIIS